MAYIGLDVGTSGCKATVLDQEGRELAHAYCEYSLNSPHPGHLEISPHDVWEGVKKALYEAAGGRCDIRALAVGSFGEAVVLLGENDAPLAESIFYTDVRGSEEVEDIICAMDRDTVQRITGMPINPMYSANKLLWIKKHQPEIFYNTKKIMLFGDYISYMLTGERGVDLSLASRSMLLDIHKRQWSDEVGSALGIDTSLLSPLVFAGTPIGMIRPCIAQGLGLNSGIIVVAGGHDQALAALGSGAVDVGDNVDGMGSSECITMVVDPGHMSEDMYNNNFCCEPHVVEGRYVTLAFNSSSGTSIKWFRDAIERERAKECAARGDNLYRLLDESCSEGPSPLLFLPHIAGSGTPYMDPSMGGALVGLRVSTTKEDIYKAVLEGICFEMMFNVELLSQKGADLKTITVVGGGSSSPVLMQIKADIMDRPVITLKSRETGTAALGLLCGFAMGDFSDIGVEAKKRAVKSAEYLPDPRRAALYRQKLLQYKRMYPAMKMIFQRGGL